MTMHADAGCDAMAMPKYAKLFKVKHAASYSGKNT
jgi:hypothetical protein